MRRPTTLPRDVRSGRLPAAQLAQNFSDLHPPLSPMQASFEAARCLFCFDAPCTEACPTGIDVPGFIRKIGTGNVRGAAVTILAENIMGSTCAAVCPVEELCERACVRNTAEHQPVAIGLLQRYATDHLFRSGVQPFRRAPESGHDVAVVGAGPAGLSCAHRLALHGHSVTVFEARPRPGGLNEYGIAAYKMVDERAAREVEFILAVGGIRVECGRTLGRDFSVAELLEDHSAVFLGLGHNAVNSLGLEPAEAAGLENAVHYIARIRQEDLATLPVGRRVVVIGGGNTAIDIAVQIRKLGAEEVTLAYRRGEVHMGATAYEREIARLNGVRIQTWASPVEIIADGTGVRGIRFEHTRSGAGGQLTGTGEYFAIDADQVFKAIGQHFDESFLAAGLCPAIENGRIRVDAERRTSLPCVWAGGDCVTGPDLTVVAVQDGKLAAESIHRYLRGIQAENRHG